MVDHVLDESVQHELLIFGLDLHLDCEVLVLLLQALLGDPITGAKIAVFDQYLVVGSMTAGASSVVNSFDRGLQFITADDDHHASHNLVYDMQQRFDVVYISRRVSRREQNRIIIIVRIGKSKAVVTITERLHSRYCTVEANYRHIRSIVQRAASLR